MSAPSPTEEQLSIITAACNSDANLIINAYAGTGKSTTLLMAERALKTRPILYLAFNKKIKEELEYKSRAEKPEKRVTSTTTVRTFNGLGHRIWAQACNSNLSLNAKKTQDILRSVIEEIPRKDQGPIWDSFWDITQGVAMAKSVGYIPEGKFPNVKRICTRSAFHACLDEQPDDLVSDCIDVVLTRSIKAAYEGAIDFNDQVYMPTLFGGPFPRFPLVKVDEYQDLNPINHSMLEKLVKGRLIGVGDPFQNIYGFRGATADGMNAAKLRYKMNQLELSVSFRCPQAIVENARWRVPSYKWLKPGGHVEKLRELNANDVPDGATIICRNNAPLFRLGIQFLSIGRSVTVGGSDIGPRLVSNMRKLGDGATPRASVLSLINDWEDSRLLKGSKTASDLAACMRVFAEHGEDLNQAIRYAEHLFNQTGALRLLTGHKSKGLEFPNVYHLDPWLIRNDEQDLNLRYVIQTRAEEAYYEIDSNHIVFN